MGRMERLYAMEETLGEFTHLGLSDIKAVELWQKWGPCLPQKDWLCTCPRPSDDVINQVRNQQKEKWKK